MLLGNDISQYNEFQIGEKVPKFAFSNWKLPSLKIKQYNCILDKDHISQFQPLDKAEVS